MKKKYTFLIYTENHIGLLNRISIIFTRHKVNVETLNTSSCVHEGLHSFVITIISTLEQAKHLAKCIEKQVEVAKVFLYREDQIISQCLALYKIAIDSKDTLRRIKTLVDTWNVRIFEQEEEFVVLEKTGTQANLEMFLKNNLRDFDVREFIQLARIIVTKPMGKLQDVLARRDEAEERVELPAHNGTVLGSRPSLSTRKYF